MIQDILIRRASIKDVSFLVDTIVAAEKSGTNNFGLAKLFDLSEDEMRFFLSKMLEEEIDGCEFSISSFIVAEFQGEVVSAFAGWIEGLNEDDLPSSILKSNLISYTIPIEKVMNAQRKVDVVKPIQIDREMGTYQLEYSYTIPEFQGKGIMHSIIDEHIKQAKFNNAKKIQVHVFDNNEAAIAAYRKAGFDVRARFVSNNTDTKNYFPSNVELLMELIF